MFQSWWQPFAALSKTVGSAVKTSEHIRLASAFSARADLYLSLGQFEKALEDEEYATKLSPDIYVFGLESFAADYAKKLLDNGKYEDALRMQNSLLSKYSGFTGTGFAEVLCERGRYNEACDWLEKLSTRSPDNPETQIRYASVVRKISESGATSPQERAAVRAAIGGANKLISKDRSSDNYALRAKVYLFNHQADQALKDIDHAISIENSFSNYKIRIEVLIEKDDYRDALKELDKSWEAYRREYDEPGDREDYDGYERATVFYALNRDKQANVLLAKVAEELSSGEAVLMKATALAEAGRYEDARMAFLHAKQAGKYENPLVALHF